jgi:putative transposase
MKLTIKYKLKTTIEQERHLSALSFYATKLYNTDNYQRRKAWEETGKIPNQYSQIPKLKSNHWYKLLPSQTAQNISFVLQQNYRSWFSLRKKDASANPPKFRKKDFLSPLTFFQQFRIIGDRIRISMSLKYRSENKIKFIEMPFEQWRRVEGIPKMCQIINFRGKWYAHIVYDVPEENPLLNDNVMAVDLGIINTAVTADSFQNSKIYSGKQILSIQHYFNKERAKLQSVLTKQYPNRHSSKSLRNMERKRNRQILQALHTYSKRIIEDCREKNIRTLVAGDLTDIRRGADKGVKFNQKLHSWSFSKFIQQLEYKCVRAGIRFVKADESYTSQMCSSCGIIRKSNRRKRGLYVCKACGSIMNADANGAKNILDKYLRDFLSRCIGKVAVPLVARLDNVVPC